MGMTDYPEEIGPPFSACAYANMAHTEFQLMSKGLHVEKVRYVFEKGDREHEIINVFKDVEKHHDRHFGPRGHGFEPKETTLLQPADLIAGTIQRCLVKGCDAIPLVDEGIGYVRLSALSSFYDSAGVTCAVVLGHDKEGCKILTGDSIKQLDMVSSVYFNFLPAQTVANRKKRYSYKPKRPK